MRDAIRARLALLVLLALGLRLLALWVAAPTPPAGDERDYLRRAERHHQGRPQGSLHNRPPLTEWSYAASFGLFGPSVSAARAVNVAAGSLTLLPVFAIARRFGGARVGLLAAAGAALYPDFVAYSGFLWAETLYLLFASSALALLVCQPGTGRAWLPPLAGVALGLAALTREVGVFFPPLAAAWLVWRERGRPRRGAWAAAALLGAFALTLLPFTLQLNRGSEHLALVSHTTWLNLYLGNVAPSQPRADRESRKRVLRRDYRALACPGIAPGAPEPLSCRGEREVAARREVLRTVAERLPAWPFEKLASELPRFFRPVAKPARRLWFEAEAQERRPEWGYRFRWALLDAPAARAGIAWGAVLAFVATALLGAAGLVLRPPGAPAGLLALFLAAQILPALAAFATARFRQPAMALFLVGAASLIAAGHAAWARASPPRRAAALATVAALALSIAAGTGLD